MPDYTALDGVPLDLERSCISRLVHEASVSSTMDLAHTLAQDGAPSGTVVVADVQHAGRGRGGKSWRSAAGDGLWCTVIERDTPASGLSVLSMRLGLAIADAVAPWCNGTVGLKWPNDVVLGAAPSLGGESSAGWCKLAGVLVEARWRDAQVEWIAIGIGLNLRVSAGDAPSGALREGVTRADVLHALIPRVRLAARAHGAFSAEEVVRWNARDMAIGRACSAPECGVVAGVQSDGALRVTMADGSEGAHRSGSLIFVAEDVTC